MAPAPRESVMLRRRLVRGLEKRGLIRTAGVREAFLAVPREPFVPEFVAREGLAAVYRDEAIPTKFDAFGRPISSSSQPAIMAEMLEQLKLEPGMRVLEIGTGTGYNAALLAEIVGPSGVVTTIDVDNEVARNARGALRHGEHRVRVVVGDGREGFADRAPYDRIVATASSDTVPRAWFEQLTQGGLLELPLRLTADGAQVIPTLRKTRARLVSVATIGGGFMPLRARDENSFTPSRPTCLVANDATGQQARALRQISGDGLATLSTAAKRRLLSVALGDSRRRPLHLRAEPDALMLFLTLTLPPARAIELSPWAVGLITRDGASLAYVGSLTNRGRRWITSLTCHGDGKAGAELAAIVRGWEAMGRPGPRNLHFTVDYRRSEARLRRVWRVA